MRLHLLFNAVRSAPRRAHLITGTTLVAAVGAITPLLLVSTADASARPATVPTVRLASATLTAPANVTRGAAVTLAARLTIGTVGLPERPLQFLARTPGSSTWQRLGSATTGVDGVAQLPVDHVSAATEYGVTYLDANGAVSSNTAARVVHVIDMRPATPRAVAYNAPVHLAGHLLEDSARGIARQRVQVRFRSSGASGWSTPTWVTTNGSGVAALTRRFTHTFQVGIVFPGADGLAPSPLRVSTVIVKPRVGMSSSGFRFPFLDPGQAESPGAWTLDQGVDMFAQGQACGAAAKLVAVGDGTVIQTGISGFGPTAPVIRMDGGPFAGRNVYYGHTGHIYVHVGEHVHIGQLVAQIGCGQVGYSAAPHLEIGVGEPGGPPCCPPFHATSSQMYHQLVAALRTS